MKIIDSLFIIHYFIIPIDLITGYGPITSSLTPPLYIFVPDLTSSNLIRPNRIALLPAPKEKKRNWPHLWPSSFLPLFSFPRRFRPVSSRLFFLLLIWFKSSRSRSRSTHIPSISRASWAKDSFTPLAVIFAVHSFQLGDYTFHIVLSLSNKVFFSPSPSSATCRQSKRYKGSCTFESSLR